jgi:hypothetical protein
MVDGKGVVGGAGGGGGEEMAEKRGEAAVLGQGLKFQK